MSKLRRNTNRTLQGAPPSCESLRILALAPCDPPGDVLPTRIPRTARDGAQCVKPVATRMGAARWRRRVAPKPPLIERKKEAWGFFRNEPCMLYKVAPRVFHTSTAYLLSVSPSVISWSRPALTPQAWCLIQETANRGASRFHRTHRIILPCSVGHGRAGVGQKVPRSP